ncbi:MAG: hypothetical protein J5699_09100 [Bacteroidales bacterium]|nr:hypothetical protein [Bacteroidales bacterium]
MRKLALALAALIIMGAGCFAQEKKTGSKNNNWEEIKAEKVGFITDKLDLTVEEAQVFWPVYNAYEKETAAANKAARKALMSLKVKEGEKVSDAEMTQRLNTYVAAKEKVAEVLATYNREFLKVLAPAKVAKLYQAEEQFTHKLIDRFAKKKYHQPGPVKPGPVKPVRPVQPKSKQDGGSTQPEN